MPATVSVLFVEENIEDFFFRSGVTNLYQLLGKLRQGNCRFKASLGDLMGPVQKKVPFKSKKKREVVQWLKHLPHKQRDWSLNPQNLWTWQPSCAHNPSLRRDSPEQDSSELAMSTSSGLDQETLPHKNKVEEC